MLRFRLLNIPFEIQPTFWIGSAILGSNRMQGENGLLLLAVWIVCACVSIVLHELGHAVAARHYGAEPHVALYQLGGLTFFPGAQFTRWQYLGVVLAGPLAGFATYCVVGVAAPYLNHALRTSEFMDSYPLVELACVAAVGNLALMNLWWTIFNLLPIRPLDGGHALGTILGPGLTEVTRWIGVLCAAGICVWVAMHGMYITAFFLGYLAFANLQGETRPLPGAPR